MYNLKRKIAILIVAVMVLSQGVVTYANTNGCSNGSHMGTSYLYNKILRYREKTGEHVITLSGGTQAVCYIYTEYYDKIDYCSNCHSTYANGTISVTNVHSLGH